MTISILSAPDRPTAIEETILSARRAVAPGPEENEFCFLLGFILDSLNEWIEEGATEERSFGVWEEIQKESMFCSLVGISRLDLARRANMENLEASGILRTVEHGLRIWSRDKTSMHSKFILHEIAVAANIKI